MLRSGFFNGSVKMNLPEKSDRTLILKHLLVDSYYLDHSEISKYLQGKSYHEIACLVKLLSKKKLDS